MVYNKGGQLIKLIAIN